MTGLKGRNPAAPTPPILGRGLPKTAMACQHGLQGSPLMVGEGNDHGNSLVDLVAFRLRADEIKSLGTLEHGRHFRKGDAVG
jgi:hypothetical protein